MLPNQPLLHSLHMSGPTPLVFSHKQHSSNIPAHTEGHTARATSGAVVNHDLVFVFTHCNQGSPLVSSERAPAIERWRTHAAAAAPVSASGRLGLWAAALPVLILCLHIHRQKHLPMCLQ